VILELIEYILTPCSWSARTMGFLRSSIQVRARYKRCQIHWQEHLELTRGMILTAAQMAPRRRRAVVFGAGLLHDIPLAELSQMFESVILADIVHTWPCRLKALEFSNVKLHRMDVTGVVKQLPRTRRSPSLPLPVSCPEEFVDDPFLDFTVSVNLLSQLSWVPGHFLSQARPDLEIAAMKSQLIFAHLDYLRRLPGHTALITDTLWSAVPVSGAHPGSREEWDVLSGVALPEPFRAWDWRIAPAPERSRDLDYVARVHAYPDWKKA
jgi:hypothetical protein